MYRVLWFDDEFETKGANTIDNANEEDIELIGVSNADIGLEMLLASPESYDAILLDGLFFLNDSDDKHVTKNAFGKVAKTISNFNNSDFRFPWFVYSGQPGFVKDKNEFQELFKDEDYGNRTYDKNSDQDQIDLWQDIKAACNEKESVRIRFKYKGVLSICDDAYIGSKQYNRIFKLLECVEDTKTIKNSEDMLNPMRKIFEALFKKLHDIGLIPDDIFNNPGKINGSSYFLSSSHSDYKFHQELIHPIVAENIYRLLQLTQDGSHNDGNKLRADEYFSENKHYHFYLSTIYLLMDILTYMKTFIDLNSNKEVNVKKWSFNVAAADMISGILIDIKDTGWGKFQCDIDTSIQVGIPPHMVESRALKVNQGFKITTKSSPDGKSTYVKNIIL
jgi:hypothetical protein